MTCLPLPLTLRHTIGVPTRAKRSRAEWFNLAGLSIRVQANSKVYKENLTAKGVSFVIDPRTGPKPYKIAQKAEKYHGITNVYACANGVVMADVIDVFEQRIALLKKNNGFLVAHNIASHIVSNDLNRTLIWTLFAMSTESMMSPLARWILPIRLTLSTQSI